MGKVYDGIEGRLAEWIVSQPVFFVATAPLAADGHVNVSPKGGRGSLVVLDPGTVAWLDLTGSGVETLAHLRQNGRITLMWCSFEGPPQIVRVHGRGEVHERGTAGFAALAGRFPGGEGPGARSVVVVHAERVSDSCGYAVPLMAEVGERDLLTRFHERKGSAGMDSYRKERNAVSLDGLPALAAADPRPVR
jgi:hypothetical protein